MASAKASAASAGLGSASRPNTRATMVCTCALSARPLPLIAALTSLGVCRATSRSWRAPANMATPITCATAITERIFSWANTRSMAITCGLWRAIQSSIASAILLRRSSGDWLGGVRATPTSTSRTRRRESTSTQPSPQRVIPGSIPKTRWSATNAPSEAGAKAFTQSSSASSSAATSALMSMEVNTFCTSSESSRASIRRITLRAVSASTSILVPATN